MKKLSVLIPVFNQEILITKAIQSIPKRDDIEIIVCDDASVDSTFKVLSAIENIKILSNEENKGVGYTVNKLLDHASGEYIVLLGSDDYFYSDIFEHVVDEFLYSFEYYDIIYFDLRTNDGTLFTLNENTKFHHCGSVKFIKRLFIGDTRCPEIRAAEDYAFYVELMKKQPKEIFTHQIVKHYNFPRKSSLINLSMYPKN